VASQHDIVGASWNLLGSRCGYPASGLDSSLGIVKIERILRLLANSFILSPTVIVLTVYQGRLRNGAATCNVSEDPVVRAVLQAGRIWQPTGVTSHRGLEAHNRWRMYGAGYRTEGRPP
jgi:hypothetical protein